MSKFKLFLALFFVLTFLAAPTSANAFSMIIRQGQGSYGYEEQNWDDMTALMDSEIGNSNITMVANFDAVNLDSYDAVWLDWGTGQLSATEVSKLQEFKNTGKRIFMIGENDFANETWNNSILGLVGGISVGDTGGVFAPIYSHPLTAGIDTVEFDFAGTTNSGTSLFTPKIATLWGSNLNIFIQMDVNVFDDNTIGNEDNTAYAQNLLEWLLASTPTPQNSTSTTTTSVYQHPSTTDTPSCGDLKPAKVPDLFEIKVDGTTAVMYFTTVLEGTTGYSVNFGLDNKAEQFGDNFSHSGPQWILNRSIQSLAPNTEYYFKIRANNGCNAGDWSMIKKVKTGKLQSK